MNCIVYQMWDAMDPLTGSAVVFQCSHMTSESILCIVFNVRVIVVAL